MHTISSEFTAILFSKNNLKLFIAFQIPEQKATDKFLPCQSLNFDLLSTSVNWKTTRIKSFKLSAHNR